MSKILYISSEAFPFIKTGGLGDVAGSLPRALQKNKQDVRLLLPAYQEVLDKVKKQNCVAETFHYGQHIRILETFLPGTRVKTWLVDSPAVFDRPGNPYLDPEGEPWHDNAFRFALFAQCAVDIALNRCGLSWQPDVAHCNDWQSALVPALLDTFPQRPATVFTIHNLAYQGMFNSQTFFDLGLPAELWGMHGVEFHQHFSFIKGGLVFADRINTVSPNYAKEIQQPEFGYGLDGLLRHRKDRLSGIINGIDTDVWNPGTDKLLAKNYNRRTLADKSKNKTYLQKQLKLPAKAKTPLIGLVSRLVEQKGFDSILAAMETLLSLPLQIAILGSGEKVYETALLDWAKKYPQKLSVTIGYDETLSHQIEAGSDIYLMPSTFEPCGLNQLYSLRYGTLPVARNVGGLADTVIDTNEKSMANKTANGFIIDNDTPAALIAAVRRSLKFYKNISVWKQLQHNAMSPDRSWQASARQYIDLYEQAIADNPHPI
ncbi:MAG: glycogen synthase GlgA [Gammaproteobacteria bacterium]|nr:glycogen synthase GlgA [Gammaproteobacteria bacterium]